MQPLISIIVPIYNVEQYLPRCIESILAQTYRNLEIILIDDGSPDNCGKICDEYAKKDDRIVVIHQENSGIIAARKPGIRSAKGEYLGFVDPDDWIDPDMYEHMMEKMLLHDVDIVMAGYYKEYEGYHECIHEEKSHLRLKQQDSDYILFHEIILRDSNTVMWNKLFKRNVPQKCYLNIPNEAKVMSDIFCAFSYFPFIDSMYISDKMVYHYNKSNEKAITNNLNYMHMIDAVRFYKYIEGIYHTHKYSDELMHILDKHFLHMIISFLPKSISQSFSAYHFPVSYLSVHSRIVIYGAGLVGMSYFRQFSKMKEMDVVCVTDTHKAGKTVGGILVQSPDILKNLDYDVIVVSVQNKLVANEIADNLEQIYHVSSNKIIWKTPIKFADTFM